MSTESSSEYRKALKAGQKYVRALIQEGKNPYPAVLEQMITETMLSGRRNLGVMEIPIERIVGTLAAGRQNAFAGNFMPLLPEKTEFGHKWKTLCDAHLGSTGITDPIQCFEYLGNFYVQEGNKRVSVLRYFGATSVCASVTRMIPLWSDDPKIQAYYEFMEFYKLSGLYQVQFERPGGYARLQAALGFDADHVWTDDERKSFRSTYYRFRRAFEQINEAEKADVSLSVALMALLQLYSLRDIHDMTDEELLHTLEAMWQDILFMSQKRPATLSTEPKREEEKTVLEKIFTERLNHLNVAFVHAVSPAVSRWALGHELGREYVVQKLGEYIDVNTYCVGEQTADELMEQAVLDGAELLIATSPSLIPASRRIAAKYPELRVMSCALSVPYAGIRTYYCRIHEAKFIAGAIAGLAAGEGHDVGYVANYPIFGVPAAINAYALGVRMTNPTAKVHLGWSCVEPLPAKRLLDAGIRVISNREFTKQETNHKGINWGTYRILEDGRQQNLASPCWNWGRLYERTIQTILNGGWNPSDEKNDTPITYWWGMDSRVIDILFDESLPDGALQLGKVLRTSLNEGAIDPFHCRITDQNGVHRNDGRGFFTPDEVMKMDWLCDNVIGSIPSYEELLPMSRNTVRLLGVYRDTIPPEKESVNL